MTFHFRVGRGIQIDIQNWTLFGKNCRTRDKVGRGVPKRPKNVRLHSWTLPQAFDSHPIFSKHGFVVMLKKFHYRDVFKIEMLKISLKEGKYIFVCKYAKQKLLKRSLGIKCALGLIREGRKLKFCILRN